MSWKVVLKDDKDLDNAILVYNFEKYITQMDRLIDSYPNNIVKNSWENFKNLLRKEVNK